MIMLFSLPNTPFFSKYFYEYAFLTEKYVSLEPPFKNEEVAHCLELDVKDMYCSDYSFYFILFIP